MCSMGKPRKTIRRKKMVAASSSGNFFQFLSEAMEAVKEKWCEIFANGEEDKQDEQELGSDQRIFPLFSHKARNNLDSLRKEECEELELLLDIYANAYLFQRFIGITPENWRKHKNALTLGRRFRQTAVKEDRFKLLRPVVDSLKGAQPERALFQRACIYSTVGRYLQKDDFWRLIESGSYLDIVTINDLKNDCKEELPLAHYSTQALIYLTTILPIIEERIEQYQAELTAKKSALDEEFFGKYKQYLEECIEKIAEQKQLLHKSLNHRFRVSENLAYHPACDDTLFVMCQRILKEVEENKKQQDNGERRDNETSSPTQENVIDKTLNHLVTLCGRVLATIIGDKQPSTADLKDKKVDIDPEKVVDNVLRQLKWIVNQPPRQTLTTKNFKEVYAYLISASEIALKDKKNKNNRLPKDINDCYAGLQQWCNVNVNGRSTKKSAMYCILHLRKKVIIVPEHFQAFIPKAPRWPASWFKGHNFRYNFSEKYLYDLVTIQSEIVNLRKRVEKSDNETGDIKRSVMHMLHYIDDTHKRYQEMKKKIAQHRVSGLRRLFYRKTNAFLDQWESDIDKLRFDLLDIQSHYFEKQTEEINKALKLVAQSIPSVRPQPKALSKTLPVDHQIPVENVTAVNKHSLEAKPLASTSTAKHLPPLEVKPLASTSTTQHLFPIKSLYGVFEDVEKELKTMHSSLRTKHSASVEKFSRAKEHFLSATDIRTYFVEEYRKFKLAGRKAKNGVDITYIENDIKELQSWIRNLHRGDQQTVFKNINFICALLLDNNNSSYNSLTLKKLQDILRPLFAGDAETKASDLIEKIILPSISTTRCAAFRFVEGCKPELAKKRKEIIYPVVDRHLDFIKEVMQLKPEVYLASINSQPKSKERHFISIDDNKEGKENKKGTAVTLENIEKAINFIEKSVQAGNHKKSLLIYLEKYLEKYTGADNAFQHVFILFQHKPIIRQYGKKLFEYYLQQKQYKKLLEEPFFSKDNPCRDCMKAMLGKHLFEHMKLHPKEHSELSITQYTKFTPIIDKFGNEECKQKYNRLYLTKVLQDRAFYFKWQKQMNKYLFVGDNVKPTDIFGESYLPNAIKQLCKFIEEYDRQPYPEILPLIKSYFTPEIVKEYQLTALQARLNTFCKNHESRTQGLNGHDAERRIEILIKSFDSLLVASEAEDISEAQEQLLSNIRSARTPAERKQVDQVEKTYPVLSRFTDYMVAQLIYRTLNNEDGFIHILKLMGTALKKGGLNTGEKIVDVLPEDVGSSDGEKVGIETTLDIVLNQLKRLPHVNDNLLAFGIIQEDLKYLPYHFKRLNQSFHEIISHQRGLSLDINETVLVLLYHWPTERNFNTRDFRHTTSSHQINNMFPDKNAVSIKTLINYLLVAKNAVKASNPLHTILTALYVVSRRGVLNEHECQLLQGFERFKTVINQITCISGVEHEHCGMYSLKKADIEWLKNNGYGDECYREFWQQQITQVIQQKRTIAIIELIRSMGSEEQKQQLTCFIESSEQRNEKGKEVDQNPERMFEPEIATETKRLLLRDRYERKQRMSQADIKEMVRYYIDDSQISPRHKPAQELKKYTEAAIKSVKRATMVLKKNNLKKTRGSVKKWLDSQPILMNACYLLASREIPKKQLEPFVDELLLEYLFCILTQVSKPSETSSANASDIVALAQIIQLLGSTNQTTLCQYWQRLLNTDKTLRLDDLPNLSTMTFDIKRCYDRLVEVVNNIITPYLQTTHQPTKNQSSSSGSSKLMSLVSSLWLTDPRVVSERTNSCLQKVLSQLKAVQHKLSQESVDCDTKELISTVIQKATTQLKGITLPQGLITLFQNIPIILRLDTQSVLPTPKSQTA